MVQLYDAEAFLDECVCILTRVSADDDFDRLVTEIIALAEKYEPGSIAGVTIVDRAAHGLERAIFGSVDKSFSDSLANVPLHPPHVGTCAQALYRGETVTSENLSIDQRFSPAWLELCEKHAIRSCRSQPLRSANGKPLGTFMLCYREPRGLAQFNDALIVRCAALVGAAFNRRQERTKNEIVVSELQHRTKNLFSSIGAVVHASFPIGIDIPTAMAAFDGRVLAMARAHNWIMSRGTVDMSTLANEMLNPYMGKRSVSISGPEVALPATWAASLSMAIHELATNASKYGALSVSGGSLEVGWQVDRSDGDSTLFQLQWVERGGPTVSVPTRKGFGVRAIERLLAQQIDGNVEIVFDPAGLRCLIEAPLNVPLVPQTGHASDSRVLS